MPSSSVNAWRSLGVSHRNYLSTSSGVLRGVTLSPGSRASLAFMWSVGWKRLQFLCARHHVVYIGKQTTPNVSVVALEGRTNGHYLSYDHVLAVLYSLRRALPETSHSSKSPISASCSSRTNCCHISGHPALASYSLYTLVSSWVKPSSIVRT